MGIYKSFQGFPLILAKHPQQAEGSCERCEQCYKDDFVLRFICKVLHEMTSRMQSAFLFCIAA